MDRNIEVGVSVEQFGEDAPMVDGAESDLCRQWERETTVRVMTAYVAHELNHPLGTILNLVNTLSRQLAKPVVKPQDIDGYIKGIKEEALRASTTIKQLRLLTDRKPASRTSVDLASVCRETVARLAPLAEAKRIRTRLEIRTERTLVKGVKELLCAALHNFLINSVAALDDPAIAERRIVIRVAAKDDRTTAVQVFDNGCGFPEEMRDRMFEPFVTTRAEGSGLGLAIAGDIARWHRGSVCCSSNRRRTCVEMSLPIE